LQDNVKVWGLFIRLFHWSLVVAFILAYITSTSGHDEIHVIVGYFITILIVLRMFGGCFGHSYTRFDSFCYSPKHIWQHAKQIFCNQPDYHVGHSPLGAAMVYALLATLLLIVSTGLISQAWGEYDGPFWLLGWMPNDSLGRWAENIHEATPDFMILLILLHIAGVILASWQHRVNLPASMIHGLKPKLDKHGCKRLQK